MKPRVVLSHPGVQYSYPFAYALQECGYLHAFHTTFYFRHSWQLPFGLQKVFHRRLYKGVQHELVFSNPWPEIFRRLGTLLFGKNYFTLNRMLFFGNNCFDRSVAAFLKRTNWDIFIGLSGGSLESLKTAKAKGKIAIVDQHDIHFSLAERLLREERELHPEFASSMPYWPPIRSYLKILEKEMTVADYIFCPSLFSYRSHREAGVSEKKLVILPHGVKIHKTQNRERNVESFNGQPFKILFMGTVTQRKGIKYLLEAVKQLRHSEKVELLLIGDWMVEKKAIAPYEGCFRYQPYIPYLELEKCFGGAHVLVLPSIYDAFGMVALDAMAAGLPVIVSEHTAAGSDVVRDGIDGYVVAIRNVEALKERILQLARDRKQAQEMGRMARERVKEFSLEVYQKRLETKILEIYESHPQTA